MQRSGIDITFIAEDTQRCRVIFGPIQNVSTQLFPIYHDIVVAIDENVLTHWKSVLLDALGGMNLLDVISVPAGEYGKQINSYLYLLEKLQESSISRRDALMVIGGGASCDMGGFAAASFMRGIPYVLVPTTFMAMVDAAHGGKVAVNLPAGKNLLGGFHLPSIVWIDMSFLSTLPSREIRQSLGEVIKIATISGDPDFFEHLELLSNEGEKLLGSHESLRYLMEYSIRCKLQLIGSDWKESNLDRLLNAGHAVAHSLERAFNFDNSLLKHGEAVALGISACTRFSQAKGFIDSNEAFRIIQVIRRLGLPVSFSLSVEAYQTALKAIDVLKRVRGGNLRLVLPEKAFRSFIYHGEDAVSVLDYLETKKSDVLQRR